MSQRALFGVLLGFLVIPISVRAKSLDEVAAGQVQQEISPVTFGGKSLVDPASVCLAMGFRRLVASAEEPCSGGARLFAFTTNDGKSASHLEEMQFSCDGFNKRLKSVTCAK